jgi:hypothetical protein
MLEPMQPRAQRLCLINRDSIHCACAANALASPLRATTPHFASRYGLVGMISGTNTNGGGSGKV